MGRLDGIEAGWQREAEAVISGMTEWRQQHPRATLNEIEAALDERLSGMRARLLEDLALASEASVVAGRGAERPACPSCRGPLEARGQRTRAVVTQGDRVLRLARDYAACPRCGGGHFPPG
jgi:hypothetical protein